MAVKEYRAYATLAAAAAAAAAKGRGNQSNLTPRAPHTVTRCLENVATVTVL